MNRITGEKLAGLEHLRQSVADILLCRIGTVTLARFYGSDYPKFIDKPGNSAVMIELFAKVADALDRYEPRFILQQIRMGLAAGEARFGFYGLWHYHWPELETKPVELMI